MAETFWRRSYGEEACVPNHLLNRLGQLSRSPQRHINTQCPPELGASALHTCCRSGPIQMTARQWFRLTCIGAFDSRASLCFEVCCSTTVPQGEGGEQGDALFFSLGQQPAGSCSESVVPGLDALCFCTPSVDQTELSLFSI